MMHSPLTIEQYHERNKMLLSTGVAIEGEGFGWAGNFPVLKGASLSEVVNALLALSGTPHQSRSAHGTLRYP